MSQKEQYSSFERALEKRQESSFSGAAEHRDLLGWLDQELDHLFKEFLESPGWIRSRKLTQKASVRSGCDAVAGRANVSDDLSAQ